MPIRRAAIDHRKAPTDHRKAPIDHRIAPTDHRQAPTDHRKATEHHESHPSSDPLCKHYKHMYCWALPILMRDDYPEDYSNKSAISRRALRIKRPTSHYCVLNEHDCETHPSIMRNTD